MTAVEDSICAERMEAQSKLIEALLAPIGKDISDMKRDLKDLKNASTNYVPWNEYKDKCREIEELKRFVWKVSGGIGVVSFLLGVAVKFLK